jgi:hypothetical protein
MAGVPIDYRCKIALQDRGLQINGVVRNYVGTGRKE